MARNRQRTSISPEMQVFGIVGVVSLIVATVGWFFIPMMGAQQWSASWFPTMAGIMSEAILEAGWGLNTAAIAFLAASLIGMTVTGLNNNSAAGALRRRATERVLTSFTLAAAAFATLPAWGFLTSFLHVLTIRSPTFADPSVALSLRQEADAFAMAFDSAIIGIAGVALLACAVMLTRATRSWVSHDEKLVSETVSALSTRIIEVDFAIQDVNVALAKAHAEGIGPLRQAIRALARMGVLLATTYFGLVVFACCWDWQATESNTSVWGWAGTMFSGLVGTSVLIVALPLILFIYLRWSTTPPIVNGKQVRSAGYRALRLLLGGFGAAIALAYVLLVFNITWSEQSHQQHGFLWGTAICMLPAILMWIPVLPGRMDVLLALAARIDHEKQFRSLVLELDEIPTSKESNDAEAPGITLSLSFPFKSLRRHS